MNRDDVSVYWTSAGLLVRCPFCCVEPFAPCKPVDVLLPNGDVLKRSTEQCQHTHMQRTYEGHRVLTRMLQAAGHARRAQYDAPEEVALGSYADLVELVEVTVGRVLSAIDKPKPRPRRATPSKARAMTRKAR